MTSARRARAARTSLRFACAAILFATSALARRGVRPLFEPTDLELEDPGSAELDLQLGVIRSPGPFRLVIPDFELDLGLLKNLELDVDGAYAIEGPAEGPFSLDHAAPDNLWPSLKLGLVAWSNHDESRIFALGTQLGPKLPMASEAHGVGVEGLALLGLSLPKTHFVLSSGAFVDPAPDAASTRLVGLEAGLDFARELDDRARYSLTGEVSGVHFTSGAPDQLLGTVGASVAPSDAIELSVVALGGLLAGSDRYGFLLGVSPHFRVW
ncbi:MAG TPA: hypothetical protein VG937_34765 [Polyangiaceae bacterium]|jgi:hypothetical protein|nr:hypothetical protein [Polyangiaceae bacterium]